MPPKAINLNLAIIVHRVLTHRRGWRVDLLMDELKIKQRTYRKYRKLLCEEFTPFLDDKGQRLIVEERDGDYRWLRLRLETSALTNTDLPAQISALHFARNTLRFLRDTDIGSAADGLLEALESNVRERHAATHMLRNLDRLLYFVPDSPKDYTGRSSVVRTLLSALFVSRRVRLTYDAANSSHTERDVEPLSLVSWRSGLYLLARSADNLHIKTYAVDRIERVSVLPVVFNYPSRVNFAPASFTNGGFGIFHQADAEPQKVELVFADIKWLKVYLKERRWHETQQFDELPDGRLKMTFEVAGMTEVWPWIRSFGTDVEVLQPVGEVPSGYSEQ